MLDRLDELVMPALVVLVIAFGVVLMVVAFAVVSPEGQFWQQNRFMELCLESEQYSRDECIRLAGEVYGR